MHGSLHHLCGRPEIDFNGRSADRSPDAPVVEGARDTAGNLYRINACSHAAPWIRSPPSDLRSASCWGRRTSHRRFPHRCQRTPVLQCGFPSTRCLQADTLALDLRREASPSSRSDHLRSSHLLRDHTQPKQRALRTLEVPPTPPYPSHPSLQMQEQRSNEKSLPLRYTETRSYSAPIAQTIAPARCSRADQRYDHTRAQAATCTHARVVLIRRA